MKAETSVGRRFWAAFGANPYMKYVLIPRSKRKGIFISRLKWWSIQYGLLVEVRSVVSGAKLRSHAFRPAAAWPRGPLWVIHVGLRAVQPLPLSTQLRTYRCVALIDAEGHVWTAPAVQEESDVLRSVRVQPCMRPVFA